MTLADMSGIKNVFQQGLVGFSSSFPKNHTCYHNTAFGQYCTLCVQIVWLLNGASWHEAPWKLGLFTFFIVKWTLHSARFNQQSSDTNLHFRGPADVIKK